MDKIIRGLKIILGVYTIGIFWGLLSLFMRAVGRVRVVGHKNLFPRKKGLLILSNHLSTADFMMPLLFFPRFLLNPFKYLPWVVMEGKYFNLWYLRAWMSFFRIIPIDNESKIPGRNRAALSQMRSVLSKKEALILFPEGGRLAKAKERKKSPKHKEIGRFRSGAIRATDGIDCEFVLVWIEGADVVLPVGGKFPYFWRASIVIRISKPFSPPVTTEELENEMLKFADQM